MEYKFLETLLKVNNVSLAYGKSQILRDVSFEIKDVVRPNMHQGQVVSIIGKSGMGKTQLFMMLSGLNDIRTKIKGVTKSGEILVGPNQKQVEVGDMGVIFQNYFVFPWRKVKNIFRDAVAKNTKIAKENQQDAINSLVNDFGLTSCMDSYPMGMSGGQRQRVSIIQQLLTGGDFILLDEPFSGLDILAKDAVVAMLQKISLTDEMKTLIIVSHDIETSVALSDTAFILSKEAGKDGATIGRTISLIERDLAWHPDIKDMPAFRETLKEIISIL